MPAAQKSSSWCEAGMKELPDGRDSAIAPLGVDVEMRHEAQPVKARGKHGLRLQVVQQLCRLLARRAGEVDEDDVGVRHLHVQAIDTAQAFGQAPGELMVRGQ